MTDDEIMEQVHNIEHDWWYDIITAKEAVKRIKGILNGVGK